MSDEEMLGEADPLLGESMLDVPSVLAGPLGYASEDLLPEDTSALEGDSTLTFGTFFVGPTEFALPTDHIREVVPYPDAVTRLPLCADAVHGIFSLRGEVLPIVDLAKLLGLEGEVARERSRVAVIEHGSVFLGIAIDRTGEVLRLAECDVHRMVHRAADDSMIVDGVIEVGGDGRFVQTLSSDVLGTIPGVPRRDAESGQQRAAVDPRTFSKAIVFSIGGIELALRIEDVLEIQSEISVTESPRYFDHCSGVVLLRGNTYPILDLRAVFGVEGKSDERRYVFVDLGGERVGLAVDQLVETIEYADDELLAVPRILATQLTCVCKSVLEPTPGRHVLVLSIPDLFEKVGVGNLREILGYGGLEEASEQDDDVELGFCAFRVGEHVICLPLDEVLEVRELGDEVFDVGRTSGELEGLMNLRGRVLPLVDARRRLGVAARARVSDDDEPSSEVALVVEVDEEAFALVVDGIVDIKRANASSITMAGGSRPGDRAGDGVMGFVRSTMMIEKWDGTTEMLVVLDASRLMATA